MNKKPTYRKVNCCEDSDLLVDYNQDDNEFQIVFQDSSSNYPTAQRIEYCPFCGILLDLNLVVDEV